ncbi:3-keto-5-aminohexanoate cleavage protein [Terrabacter carboxydivorans]|uniref:3-keto-5-aminohexanoate cleavage protein n=1 Tax=Terrabacter carboxydivorans TaxID=619730 RepID=A0ABP5Y9Y3_9MICO
MIKACLNGDRTRGQHPHVPQTPDELARAAADAVAAGASMVHVHPRDDSGSETLEARHVVEVVGAIKAATPGLRVSVSTRDGIVASARHKLSHVSDWPSPQLGGPDCASVNWHEEGAVEIATALHDKGIGVEAGIWTPEAATRFVGTGWPGQVERVLVEVIPGATPGSDGPLAAERVLAALGRSTAPVLVHGEEQWAWTVLRWAQAAGHDLRIGLEDVCHLPDGREARDSAELVAATVRTEPHAPSPRPVGDASG